MKKQPCIYYYNQKKVTPEKVKTKIYFAMLVIAGAKKRRHHVTPILIIPYNNRC